MSYADIVGYESIVGMDELDSLDSVGDNIAIGDELADLYMATGANGGSPAVVQRNPTALRKLASQLDLARQVDPRAVGVVDRPATRRREYPIGFEALADTPPAGVTTVEARPQISFRGERLVIPSDISLFFVMDDLVVGKNSQLVAVGAIPAATFSEVGVGVRLNLDTANVGNLISLRVRNISADDQRFRATIIGTAVE